MSAHASIDPITAAVIQGALENIAIEMGHKLMRMSYSSIIRESEDFGAALIDAVGNQLCECTQSTPLQSGPIPGYITGILEKFKERGDVFREGDVIMHNDAYAGASHGPDVAFIVPVFHEGELFGFSATTAHHLDIGALTPGSCGIVDAVDAFAEGLQFKAIKAYDQGVKNEPVWQILRDNIRAPFLVVGDMEAQIAASRIGADRLKDLLAKFGREQVGAASAALMDNSEKLMRDAIRALPDGRYAAQTFIDGFELEEDPKYRDLPLCVTVIVEGDELIVDLEGTAPQVDDRPINMPLVGTVDCAIWLTIRSILLDSEHFGAIPQNSGLTRPITIKAPRGCLANPIFPAPTIARFCPGNQLADTLMKALSKIVPDKVSAGIGNLKVMAFSGIEGDSHWVHMEIFEGSYGGRAAKDGMDAVDTLYANTRNNPIEDIETHLPLRVERYELRDVPPAPGKYRGGLGSVRAFRMLTSGGVSVEGEGHLYAPWGFQGGADGTTATLTHDMGEQGQKPLPSKLPHRAVGSGDLFIVEGTGGGGYGPAFERDPHAVLQDVLDGLLDVATARADYGVAIAPDMTVDHGTTATLRAV